MTATGSDRVGGLRLGQERREFAEALRALLAALGLPADHCADLFRVAPATLDGYLSGSRIAPWEFVEDLLHALHDGPDPATRERLRRLRLAALRVDRSIGRAVRQIESQLHAAERELQQADEQAGRTHRALTALLHPPAHPAPHTTTDPGAATEPTIAIDPGTGTGTGTGTEPSGEAARLVEELERARELAALAGARCALLERQLVLVEEQQGTSAAPPPPARPSAAGPLPRILLVDDHRENLLALEALLGPHGHELVSATSGPDALRALMDPDDYAVILLDVQMPGMDGYETAAHIKRRARTRDIPIVFVTAIGSDPDHSMRAFAAGAADFLPKPVDPWALRAKVGVFVELHHQRHHRTT